MINDQELLSAISNLKNELLNNPLVVSFLKLKKEINKSKHLKRLREQIITSKKMMAQYMNDDQLYFKYKNEYETFKKEYDENPLVVNHQILYEEVYSLLNQVKDVLGLE